MSGSTRPRTSSLSASEEATLFSAVEGVTRKGVGVIYVTHRLSEVFRLSQRVTVLRDGRNVDTFDTKSSDIPSLVSAIVGVFLERIAEAVERRHYADLPPAPAYFRAAACWA